MRFLLVPLCLALCPFGVANAQQAPLARGELSVPGVTIEITKLERVPNQKIVEMRFNVVNATAQPVPLAKLGLERETMTGRGNFGSVAGIELLDLSSGISYGIGGDSGYNLSTRWSSDGKSDDKAIAPGARRSFWAWFGAPPPNVVKVAVYAPGAPPMLDVAIGGK